jgi:hypothetical protein
MLQNDSPTFQEIRSFLLRYMETDLDLITAQQSGAYICCDNDAANTFIRRWPDLGKFFIRGDEGLVLAIPPSHAAHWVRVIARSGMN